MALPECALCQNSKSSGCLRPSQYKVAQAGTQHLVLFELLPPFGPGALQQQQQQTGGGGSTCDGDGSSRGGDGDGSSSSAGLPPCCLHQCYHDVHRLLLEAYPQRASDVWRFVYRGRCPLTGEQLRHSAGGGGGGGGGDGGGDAGGYIASFEPYLTACLWLGGEVVVAAALRLNLPPPPSSASASSSAAASASSGAGISHVQIVLQATAPRLQRRGLGRLLTRCVMRAAVQEGHQVQRYEGASTLYGPHTLDAYIQELLALADSMLANTPHDPTAGGSTAPPDLQSRQWALLPPVVLDAVPPGAVFGQVTQQPGRDSYAPGQVVNATFRAANPRNNLHTNGSFLTVERWQSKSRARHRQQQPPPQEVKGQVIRPLAGEQQKQKQKQGAFAKALGALWQASGARLWRLLSRSAVQQQPAAVAEVAVAAVAGTRGGDAATAGAAAGASSGGAQAGGGGAGATGATAAGVREEGEEVWFAAQSPCSSGRSLPAATAGAAAAAAAEGTAAEGVAAGGVADGPAADGAAEEGEWVAVHDDRDWVTRFHWDRHAELSPLSYATLVWEVPPDTPPGTYRLRYRGDAKLLSGAVRPFEGCSAAFRVEEAAAAAAVEENDG